VFVIVGNVKPDYNDEKFIDQPIVKIPAQKAYELPDSELNPKKDIYISIYYSERSWRGTPTGTWKINGTQEPALSDPKVIRTVYVAFDGQYLSPQTGPLGGRLGITDSGYVLDVDRNVKIPEFTTVDIPSRRAPVRTEDIPLWWGDLTLDGNSILDVFNHIDPAKGQELLWRILLKSANKDIEYCVGGIKDGIRYDSLVHDIIKQTGDPILLGYAIGLIPMDSLYLEKSFNSNGQTALEVAQERLSKQQSPAGRKPLQDCIDILQNPKKCKDSDGFVTARNENKIKY